MRALVVAVLAIAALACGAGDSAMTAPSGGVGAGPAERVIIEATTALPYVRPYTTVISEGDDIDFVFILGAGVECGVRFLPQSGRPVPRNIDIDEGNRTVRRRFLAGDFGEPVTYTVRCFARDRLETFDGGQIYVF